MTLTVHICDGCDAEWWGASKLDVLEAGWKFHDAKHGRFFVMCGGCERRFGPSSGHRGGVNVRHRHAPL